MLDVVARLSVLCSIYIYMCALYDKSMFYSMCMFYILYVFVLFYVYYANPTTSLKSQLFEGVFFLGRREWKISR